MIKFKLGIFLFPFLLITGCSGQEQQESVEDSEEIELVNETDSLSHELSAGSDSVEKKLQDLQATLDNLNNELQQ